MRSLRSALTIVANFACERRGGSVPPVDQKENRPAMVADRFVVYLVKACRVARQVATPNPAPC